MYNDWSWIIHYIVKIPHDQIIAAYCRAVNTSGPLQTKCLKSYGIPVGQVGFSTNHLLASQITSNSSDNQEYFGFKNILDTYFSTKFPGGEMISLQSFVLIFSCILIRMNEWIVLFFQRKNKNKFILQLLHTNVTMSLFQSGLRRKTVFKNIVYKKMN